MGSDTALRQEIRSSLDDARRRIRSYMGLYSNENLIRDVLRACDDTTVRVDPAPQLDEARRIIEDRCRRLVQVTDRFTDRDPAVIGTARAQAIAAIDMLQDTVFRLRKVHTTDPRLCGLLRRPSL